MAYEVGADIVGGIGNSSPPPIDWAQQHIINNALSSKISQNVVDITTKMDLVSGYTGEIPLFSANGNLQTSTYTVNTTSLNTTSIPIGSVIQTLLDLKAEDLSVIHKLPSALSDEIIKFDNSGDLEESGIKLDDIVLKSVYGVGDVNNTNIVDRSIDSDTSSEVAPLVGSVPKSVLGIDKAGVVGDIQDAVLLDTEYLSDLPTEADKIGKDKSKLIYNEVNNKYELDYNNTNLYFWDIGLLYIQGSLVLSGDGIHTDIYECVNGVVGGNEPYLDTSGEWKRKTYIQNNTDNNGVIDLEIIGAYNGVEDKYNIPNLPDYASATDIFDIYNGGFLLSKSDYTINYALKEITLAKPPFSIETDKITGKMYFLLTDFFNYNYKDFCPEGYLSGGWLEYGSPAEIKVLPYRFGIGMNIGVSSDIDTLIDISDGNNWVGNIPTSQNKVFCWCYVSDQKVFKLSDTVLDKATLEGIGVGTNWYFLGYFQVMGGTVSHFGYITNDKSCEYYFQGTNQMIESVELLNITDGNSQTNNILACLPTDSYSKSFDINYNGTASSGTRVQLKFMTDFIKKEVECFNEVGISSSSGTLYPTNSKNMGSVILSLKNNNIKIDSRARKLVLSQSYFSYSNRGEVK